jgi:hypothetical protein
MFGERTYKMETPSEPAWAWLACTALPMGRVFDISQTEAGARRGGPMGGLQS